MGVMSTPNAGGITPRTDFNNGSVGNTAISHGISVTFVVGYQLNTTRISIANDIRFRNGSKNDAVGWTQASVADKTNDELNCVVAVAVVDITSAADAGSVK